MKEIDLSGYSMKLEHASAFRKLSELSQCVLVVSEESLYSSFPFISRDARLGELRKDAEVGLRVVLDVCGKLSRGSGDMSLIVNDNPSSLVNDDMSSLVNDNISSLTNNNPSNTRSLAEPVQSIQAYLAKLPPEEAENDPILSALVASLPDLLRFLKTPSVGSLALCDK